VSSAPDELSHPDSYFKATFKIPPFSAALLNWPQFKGLRFIQITPIPEWTMCYIRRIIDVNEIS
jgi:hypothetical protein